MHGHLNVKVVLTVGVETSLCIVWQCSQRTAPQYNQRNFGFFGGEGVGRTLNMSLDWLRCGAVCDCTMKTYVVVNGVAEKNRLKAIKTLRFMQLDICTAGAEHNNHSSRVT